MNNGLVIVLALAILGSAAESVNYDSTRQGQLPSGWSAPAARDWEVRSDKTAPSHPNVLLGASGAAAEAGPPLALFDKVVCRDGDVSVKFRIDGRQPGNAAGIVWRYQDANNYYLLRLSAGDRNIVLEHVQNGVPKIISTSGGKSAPVGVAEDIRPGQWHVVKVSFRGPKVQVFFGNRSVFTAEDSGNLNPGRTGLWARGATGAAFDDFRVDKKA
jgi:hypothetical protein